MGLVDAVLDFLYPPRCPKCNAYVEERGGWCPECLRETVSVQRLPLSAELAGVMNAAWAMGHYRGALQNLIRGLKYHGKKENLLRIRTFLQACGKACEVLPEQLLAVPVPLHPAREKQRGFNQVEWIFRPWLMERGIPMERMLCRIRQTEAQYGLSPLERQKNLEGAFAMARDADVRGKALLLVDDIMTTGTTFRACAKVLKEAGAVAVYGLVLASDRA